MKNWDAPVYAFFKPKPTIKYVNGRKVHIFECAAKPCLKGKFIRRFLYTGNSSSTSNLRHHVKNCWGEDCLSAADQVCDVKTLRQTLNNHKPSNGLLTTAFEWLGKGVVTYSHCQHTKIKARYVPNYCSDSY